MTSRPELVRPAALRDAPGEAIASLTALFMAPATTCHGRLALIRARLVAHPRGCADLP